MARILFKYRRRETGSQLTILGEFMQYQLIQAVRAGQFDAARLKRPDHNVLQPYNRAAGTDSTMWAVSSPLNREADRSGEEGSGGVYACFVASVR